MKKLFIIISLLFVGFISSQEVEVNLIEKNPPVLLDKIDVDGTDATIANVMDSISVSKVMFAQVNEAVVYIKKGNVGLEYLLSLLFILLPALISLIGRILVLALNIVEIFTNIETDEKLDKIRHLLDSIQEATEVDAKKKDEVAYESKEREEEELTESADSDNYGNCPFCGSPLVVLSQAPLVLECSNTKCFNRFYPK